jgi:hypothetical protein
MPRLSRDFEPVEPLTKRWFYIDFSPELGAGEIIQNATFTCSVVRGIDSSPQSHVLSSPNIIGSQVGAFCGNFIGGVGYSLEAIASTNLGNVLVWNARAYCQTAADR